jgi:hypothetical protein
MSDFTPPPPAPSVPSYAPQGQYPAERYNVLAIIGFIGAFVFALAGLIISIIARNQIKRTGEKGAGLAKWGIIVSIIVLALYVLIVVGSIILAFAAAGLQSGSSY